MYDSRGILNLDNQTGSGSDPFLIANQDPNFSTDSGPAGSVRIRIHNSGYKVIAALLLFVLFLVSFLGNILLISTISSSLTLRRLSYNIILLQVEIF